MKFYDCATAPSPRRVRIFAAERALTSIWNIKVEQQGFLACAEAFRNYAKGLRKRAIAGPDAFEQIPELAERGRERVKRFFNRLDMQLGKNTYIAGNHFSIADISAMVAVDFAGWAKITVPDDASNLTRWYASVSARPSARA